MGVVSDTMWNRRPPNLRRRKKKGVWYYSYQDPETGLETGLGTSWDDAKQAVQVVNARRQSNPVEALVSRIEVPEEPWGQHLKWFDQHVLGEWRSKTGKPMDDETLYIRRLYLAKIRAHFGEHTETASITRRDAVKFLDLQTAQQHNRYRQFLDQVFRHAVVRGLRDDNPMQLTIAKQFMKQRQRLSMPAYETIHKNVAPWMQRAMDLAFWSLQRREDMATWKIGEHWRDAKLYVRQGKVEGHGVGLIRITPGKQLLKAIIACLNSPDRADCPYLVHAVPRKTGRKAEWRTHPLQVDPDMLTREFKRIADQHKVFDGMTEEEKPTWHEIRALGGDVYRTLLKWPEERVQALMGHTTIKTTRGYLEGHGERWAEVTAG